MTSTVVLSTCARPLLLLPLALILQAGFVKEWQWTETASPPVLVTGRILDVHRTGRVPEGQLPWKAETWSNLAGVEVLRSFTAPGIAAPSHQIQVYFFTYGSSVKGFVNGSPPPLPDITPGAIRILPLRQNRNPASEPWQLIADSGFNLTVPVRADRNGEPAPPPSTRAFLLQEFSNTLGGGTPSEIAALSRYLSRQSDGLSGELMPLLETQVGSNRQRWAEIAAGLYAAQGIPRPTVSKILSAKPETFAVPGPQRGNLSLIQAALRKLQPTPETPTPDTEDLLIRTWIANAPFNFWGSANSLVEYANNPVTTDTLRRALRNDLCGSSYIALVLARQGNKAIRPGAIARAFRVINDPKHRGCDSTELQGAAALLRDYGSDRDLTHLAAFVRKYQTLDPDYYSALWQFATESVNPREIPVLAVVLTDRRIQCCGFRYCDFALYEFDRITKQDFDITAATIPERDAAISRALAWIKAH